MVDIFEVDVISFNLPIFHLASSIVILLHFGPGQLLPFHFAAASTRDEPASSFLGTSLALRHIP
jgi:hypothetical protein